MYQGFHTSPFQFYTSFKLENYTHTHNYRYMQLYTTIISNNLIHSTLPSIHISLISIQVLLIHISVIHTHQCLIHTHQCPIHTIIIHKYTSLIHRYRLGNFHYALGGSLELWLPLEVKMALTKLEPGRG
jgi:hypothetical protein